MKTPGDLIKSDLYRYAGRMGFVKLITGLRIPGFRYTYDNPISWYPFFEISYWYLTGDDDQGEAVHGRPPVRINDKNRHFFSSCDRL